MNFSKTLLEYSHIITNDTIYFNISILSSHVISPLKFKKNKLFQDVHVLPNFTFKVAVRTVYNIFTNNTQIVFYLDIVMLLMNNFIVDNISFFFK